MKEQLIKEFEQWYNKPLPDPDHCPLEVAYLVKLFLYYRKPE